MDLPITDDGIRPKGEQEKCFYCDAQKGEHAPDCVCVQRSVVMEVTVRYVAPEPRASTAEFIEEMRNEGSWCVSNAINHLAALDSCLCTVASLRFVREATPKDHQVLPVVGVEPGPAPVRAHVRRGAD